MKLKTLLLIFLFSVLIAPIPSMFVFADEEEEIEDLQEKIEEYEEKINELQDRADTLQNEIEYMDSQINLTELKIQNSIYNINATQIEIEKLEDDIGNLVIRIEKLEDSIEYQKKILASRMRERYKIKEDSPIFIIFGSSTLNRIIQKSEYLKVMEKYDNKLIDEMSDTKDAFDLQKRLFEEKKEEEETLKAQLQVEKANLDSYKATLATQQADKQRLLADTNNDEDKYQELLQKAQEELSSYKAFTQYAGGGVIGAGEFGSGEEGWYFSQRDSRWAGQYIGKSQDTIFEVGCLITSVAMVHKSYGVDTTPSKIASDSDNFWYRTAYMLIPWPAPSGKSYRAISTGSIDNEIDDRPVIVGVYAGPYGTHFVVLSEKDGSDYIMYDPYYGPDLDFSDYYSKSSIFQAVVFK